MTLSMNKKKALFASLLALTMTAAFAAKGERRGPPAEAVEACANQEAGTACTFTSRRGDALTGVCSTPPRAEDGVLACKPEGGRGPRGRGPRGGSED